MFVLAGGCQIGGGKHLEDDSDSVAQPGEAEPGTNGEPSETGSRVVDDEPIDVAMRTQDTEPKDTWPQPPDSVPVDAQTDSPGEDTPQDNVPVDAQTDSPGEDTPPITRCTADEDVPQQTDYAQPGPYKVGVVEMTLQDYSRPIEGTETRWPSPARTLVTRIYYPAQTDPVFGFLPAPVAQEAPFPMLMYSHGYSSYLEESNTAGRHLASHGYIVVAPTFPLTAFLANGGTPDVSDVINQPGDISYLIDQMLIFSKDSLNLFAGAVDAERIGALGVSFGGLTTLLVSLHADCYDPRIRAAMPVAPVASALVKGFYHETRTIPLLFMHGNLDAMVDYENNSRRAFELASPHARLITVDNGSHAAFALPIDEDLQMAFSSLIVPPEWNAENPDALGCAAVGTTLARDGFDYLPALGGRDNYIDDINPKELWCQGDQMTKPALGKREQQDILARSAAAFFDAYLGASEERRRDGCRYLLYEVPRLPAVTLE